MPRKLLLIDDDEALRHMYTFILSKAGYEVTTAPDGVEGLAKIQHGGWDLILLDLMMPKLDGVGVLKGLRAAGAEAKNGPIIVLSNAGYNDVAKEALSLGAQIFLLKADLLPKDLVKKIESLLG